MFNLSLLLSDMQCHVTCCFNGCLFMVTNFIACCMYMVGIATKKSYYERMHWPDVNCSSLHSLWSYAFFLGTTEYFDGYLAPMYMACDSTVKYLQVKHLPLMLCKIVAQIHECVCSDLLQARITVLISV